MGIVLQNAILAFLESDQGGTLADLRKFRWIREVKERRETSEQSDWTTDGRVRKVAASSSPIPKPPLPQKITPVLPKLEIPEPLPPQIAKPEITSNTPSPSAEPKQSSSDKGIGGNQHNLIRERIELAARELGYSTSRENSTGSGGKIDVVLEKPGRAIACEIAITTTIDHEVGNVAKCLKAGFKHVAVISPSVDRLQKIENAVRSSIAKDEADRVAYYEPDTFIARLQELSTTDAAVPISATPSVSTFGKYKVRRSAASLTPEELKQRESAALGILAETMRRKK